MHVKNSSQNGCPVFVEKKLRELSALAEMNKEIHSTMNISRLLQILVEKTVIGVNFERGLIYLLEGNYLRCVAFLDRIKREKASIIKKKIGFQIEETAVEILAVKMSKTIYVKDALADKRISAKFLRISDTREYCVVPLIGRNNVLGVLTGDKFYSKGPIFPEEIKTLEIFAGHISLAIENAKLYEEKEHFSKLLEKKVSERTSELAHTNMELSRKMNELSALYQMSQLLNKSLEKDAVLCQIISMVRRLGHDICSIRMLEGGKFKIVSSAGLDKGYEKFSDLPLTQDLLDDILSSTNPFTINDLGSAPMVAAFRDYCRERKFRSCLIVPMLAKGNLIAILSIYSQSNSFFDNEQKIFFSAFAQQAGVALENTVIFQKVVSEKNHITTISKKIEQENIYLREKIRSDFVIGQSPSMNCVMDLIRKVAPTSTTVAISGETGTGKELIARAIHEMSPRKDNPLINVNCAAIPDELIESELFGHKKGAFTGAYKNSIGMFELANRGTIFLDEIGDLSLKTQTKLLRVLQEQEIQPLGSKTSLCVDVRVISATNKDLRKQMGKKGFRTDLFYRLNVFPIHLPPLRERKEDIQELVGFFLNKHSHIRRKRIKLHQEVINAFLNYSWPGNIRELENMIERLIIICSNKVITKDDLPKELSQESNFNMPINPLREAIHEFKKDMVTRALDKAGGKKSRAADLLDLPRSNFSRLMKSLEI